jgi:hypothetical protein
MSLGSIPSWLISELQFLTAAPLGFMLTLVGALMPDASVPLCPMLAHTFFSFDLADVSAQCCGLAPSAGVGAQSRLPTVPTGEPW